MDTTKCITNDIWELYAAGKLTPEQLQYVEEHALSCEPCTDIKEGIDAMADPSTLAQRVADINTLVDHKVKKETQVKRLYFYVAAAASVVMVIGLGLVLWNNQQTPIAMHEQHESGKSAPQGNVSEATPPLSKEEIRQGTNGASAPVRKPETIQEAEQSGPTLDLALADNMKDNNTGQVEPSEDVSVDKEQEEKVTFAQTIKNKTPRTETLPAPVNISNNMAYNITSSQTSSGTFSTLDSTAFARKLSQSVSVSDSDAYRYDQALKFYSDKQYDSCRITLKPILANSHSEFYEDGLLLLTRTQMKQHKTKNAQETLKKVISLQGKRQKEAQEIMNGLK